MPEYIKHYQSRQAFLDYVTSPFPEYRRGSSSHDKDADWTGGLDFPGAVLAGKFGRPELAKSVDEGAARVVYEVDKAILQYTPARKPYYDVVGSSVELGRYIDKVPECLARNREIDEKKLLRFCVNVAASAYFDANALLNRANVVAAAIRSLEINGYLVALDVCHSGERGDCRHCSFVRIKEPDEYLSPGLIGFWSGHPAVLRRLFFSEMEHWPKEEQCAFDVGHGYGSPWKMGASRYANYDVWTNEICSSEAECVIDKIKADLSKLGDRLEVGYGA